MRGGTRSHRSTVAALVLCLLATALSVVALPRAGAQDNPSSTARASVADHSLSWGQTTTVSGTGWAAGKSLQIILYAGGHDLGHPVVGGDGSFSATVRIPSGIGSSTKYGIVVQGPAADGAYGYVQTIVTVTGPTPSIDISSRTLHWFEGATVTGERYKAGASVSVALFPDNVPLAKVTAGSDNRFSAPIRIPGNLRSAKDYQVVVTGQGIDQIFHFDLIQVTILGDRPTISLSTTTATRGSSLTVKGDLFLKGTIATITLLPGFERLGSVTIGDDNTFSAAVTVPANANGTDPHQIVVTGQGTDGLIAYLAKAINLKGKPPARSTTPSTDPATGAILRPPEDPDRTVGTIEPSPTVPEVGGVGNELFAVLMIILGAILVILLITVTARRDVRLRMRRRWDRFRWRLARRGT